MTDTDDDTAAFSRSAGLPAELGDCSSTVKAKVPDKLKFDTARLVHTLNTTESDLIRELLMDRVWGEEETNRLLLAERRRVTGKGPRNGPEQGKVQS